MRSLFLRHETNAGLRPYYLDAPCSGARHLIEIIVRLPSTCCVDIRKIRAKSAERRKEGVCSHLMPDVFTVDTDHRHLWLCCVLWGNSGSVVVWGAGVLMCL